MSMEQLLQLTHLQRRSVQFRYPTQESQERKIPSQSCWQETKARAFLPSAMSLTKAVSEIKVVNQFSPNDASEIVQYDSRASSSMMETSLINEIKLWEQMCDVDKSIIQKVEKGFHAIDTQIQSLAAQFDVCFSLQKKAEDNFQSYQKLVKGTIFTKISRSNCRKTMPRNVYYCQYWDAICWKPINQRFPSQTQMIHISQILQVHTNVQSYQKIRKNFQLPQWADYNCFLALEAKNGVFLELLAPEPQTRNLYVKVLDALIINQGRGIGGTDTNFLVTQYGQDVNNIRKTLDTTRQFFCQNIEKLKNSFVMTTKTMLNDEKLKAKKMMKNKPMIFQDKIQTSMEDLLFENQNLTTQINILEEELLSAQDLCDDQYNQKEMNEVFRLTQDILDMNGDGGIQNESSSIGVFSVRNVFVDTLDNIARLKVHQEASNHIEIQLRQELVDQQSEYQTQIVEARQIQNQSQLERDDLLQANEELALKLDEFQLIIELKQGQFSAVVNDMREMQNTIKTLMVQRPQLVVVDQYKQESDKLKLMMKQKLNQFKQQVVQDEKQSSKLFGNILSLLSNLVILPKDLNLSPEVVIKNLCYVLSDIDSNKEYRLQLLAIVSSIESKVNFYMSNSDYKYSFLDSFKQGLESFRQFNSKSLTSQSKCILKNSVHSSNQRSSRETFHQPNLTQN